MKKRISLLKQKLDSFSADGILIGSLPNIRYLTGFTGSAGWLIISQKNSLLGVDFRYVEQAKIETADMDIIHLKKDISEWLIDVYSELGIKKLAIESDYLSFSQYQKLHQVIKKKNSKLQLIPVQNAVESLRILKDREELGKIEKACEIVDDAVEFIKCQLKAGKTEKQFAWELECFIRSKGSESLPFDIIVASGSNAALPHAKPTDKIIGTGEPIIIDMGARYRGYCSDITRTFIIGEEDSNFNKIYNIVLSAQLSGISLIKENMKATNADDIVRSMISNAGYGEYFGHGLGHGIGLETHELPRISMVSDDEIKAGMVFTIEPGIYMPGWGGVRIEDTVTVVNGQVVCMTKANKNALLNGG